jgi:hypothetical protein
MPKVDMPSFTMPKVDAPDMPTFTIPKVDVPDMPKFSLPKVDMPAPKYDLDVPIFNMPSRAPPVVDENLESQEVRDARAAERNAAFKEAKDEVKVGVVFIASFFLRGFRPGVIATGGGG